MATVITNNKGLLNDSNNRFSEVSTGETYNKLLKYEPWLHVFFWMVTLFYQYLKFMELDYPVTPAHCFTEMGFNMIPAYLLYFLFLPSKLRKSLLIILPLMFVSNAWLYSYVDGFFHLDGTVMKWESFSLNLIRHIAMSLFFFALYSIKQLYKNQKQLESITNKVQQAQLRLLKGQINPHFLFNTLNTIYASALEKNDMTPDLILKLSDNFRYILHEGQKNKVPLEKEIRHIQDYINLQQERLSKKIKVKWVENIDNYQQLFPPMLLISFVENAFKYSSMLSGNDHEILIQIDLQADMFNFYCENEFQEFNMKEIDSNWQESGIGLQNSRQRLELMFPDKHQLKIDVESQKFKVDLMVEL